MRYGPPLYAAGRRVIAASEPWWVYAAMPVLGAVVGYLTKLLALEMIFGPLKFRGIGPIGWQGIVPRRAAKMAALTVDTLTAELLNPNELLELVDAEQVAQAVEGPLRGSVDAMAVEVAEAVSPGLWAALPESARDVVLARTRRSVPQAMGRLMDDLRDNLDQILDIQHLVVTRLVGDKALLVKVFRGIAGSELRFMATAGAVSGALIGCIQALVFAVTDSHLVLPLFGLLTGGLTDWLALHMIFRPVKRSRLFGVLPWQGVFHAKRDRIMRRYSTIVTEELITPASVLEALLTGPASDRLYALIETEIRQSVDAQAGIVRPLARMTVGSVRYEAMKSRIAHVVTARIPAEAARLERYSQEAGLDEFLFQRMTQMTDDEYEELMRPVFRDDEKTVIFVGALLGFVVGELQTLVLL